MGKGRSDGQRLKLLRLKQYLLENTDENHSVTVRDIIKHMDDERIAVERKTVYTDIKLLQDEEDDIEIESNRKGEYAITAREFELTDLQLIIDCVQTSQFITQKYADELSEKLKGLTSKHGRKVLNRRCSIVNRVRNMNNSAFWGIDDIHKAIETNRKILFTAGECFENKVIVSPISLIWHENNYFLFCFLNHVFNELPLGEDEEYALDQRTTYPVNKMYEIEILDEPREGIEKFSKSEIDEASVIPFSYIGAVETATTVTMRVFSLVMDMTIESLHYYFGNNVKIIQQKNEYDITVSVKTHINQGFFNWLIGMENNIEILSPDWILHDMYVHVIEKADYFRQIKEEWDKREIVLKPNSLLHMQFSVIADWKDKIKRGYVKRKKNK
jgi:Fe2+ or Zn2+ uptake regulation protein